MIKIDSNKALPVSKANREAKKNLDRIFREYADAYARLYVRRPESYTVRATDGWLIVKPGGEVMSHKRMKQLTRNMNDRNVASN